MAFHRLSAPSLVALLLSTAGPALADGACRDASFCPDLQLVRACEVTGCGMADSFRSRGQLEERIVDQGLDGTGSPMICSRLRFAQEAYIQAAAYGDATALADRDRVRGKMKTLCRAGFW